MKKQLLTLQQLISVMDPELYRHLGSFVICAPLTTKLTRWLQRKPKALICSFVSGRFRHRVLWLILIWTQLGSYRIQARISFRGCPSIMGSVMDGLLQQRVCPLCGTCRSRITSRCNSALPRRGVSFPCNYFNQSHHLFNGTVRRDTQGLFFKKFMM